LSRQSPQTTGYHSHTHFSTPFAALRKKISQSEKIAFDTAWQRDDDMISQLNTTGNKDKELTMEKTRQTKGHRLTSRLMTVTRRGSSCVGGMAWETPYIEFSDVVGNEYRWQSDNINASNTTAELRAGDRVYLTGFAYPLADGVDSLRRVSVQKIG
jgi:hypothetical protein